jgi:hypothetical protein
MALTLALSHCVGEGISKRVDFLFLHLLAGVGEGEGLSGGI